MNNSIEQVKDFIRHPFAHGGYPKVLIMDDGECLCAECAKVNFTLICHSTKHDYKDGWHAMGVDIHWEGEPIPCVNCGTGIESAYGIPDSWGHENV